MEPNREAPAPGRAHVLVMVEANLPGDVLVENLPLLAG